MQIIIDIPSAMYNDIKSGKDGYSNYVHSAVRIGTPLPKHGRLKDIDKIISDGASKGFCDWYDEMKYAPTIIEAEKGYEAEVITRGNCMMCGKALDEGLFFCKECEAKVESEEV